MGKTLASLLAVFQAVKFPCTGQPLANRERLVSLAQGCHPALPSQDVARLRFDQGCPACLRMLLPQPAEVAVPGVSADFL